MSWSVWAVSWAGSDFELALTIQLTTAEDNSLTARIGLDPTPAMQAAWAIPFWQSAELALSPWESTFQGGGVAPVSVPLAEPPEVVTLRRVADPAIASFLAAQADSSRRFWSAVLPLLTRPPDPPDGPTVTIADPEAHSVGPLLQGAQPAAVRAEFRGDTIRLLSAAGETVASVTIGDRLPSPDGLGFPRKVIVTIQPRKVPAELQVASRSSQDAEPRTEILRAMLDVGALEVVLHFRPVAPDLIALTHYRALSDPRTPLCRVDFTGKEQ